MCHSLVFAKHANVQRLKHHHNCKEAYVAQLVAQEDQRVHGLNPGRDRDKIWLVFLLCPGVFRTVEF